MKIEKKDVLKVLSNHEHCMKDFAYKQILSFINSLPTTDDKHDADIMFNALWAIISDDKIDDLDKCMTVASTAINSIIDKTRNDTPTK